MPIPWNILLQYSMTAVRCETNGQFQTSGIMTHTAVSLAVLDVWSLVLRNAFRISQRRVGPPIYLLFNLWKDISLAQRTGRMNSNGAAPGLSIPGQI